MNFLLAPFYSLFSLSFYRKILSRSLKLGFLYLGYLSLLFSLWALVLFNLRAVPSIGEFASWLGANLPKITLTAQGMRLDPNEPVLLTHPRYGPIFYFDPTIDAPKPEDFSKALVILTRTKAAFHNPNTGEVRMQSLIPARPSLGRNEIEITGERVTQLWSRAKPFVSLIFFFSGFLGTFFWKLMAALIYSSIGLLWNLFRKVRLTYGRILHVTFFALTPMSFWQWLSWQFPALHLPANFLVSLVLTNAYLAVILFGTQERKPAEN